MAKELENEFDLKDDSMNRLLKAAGHKVINV